MKTQLLRGNFRVYWYEYPAGQGPHGSGGWSKHAQHRPAPVLVIQRPRRLELAGAFVLVDGVRKRKCTIVRPSTGEIIREDYGIERIKQDLLTNTTSSVELELASRGSTLARPLMGERKFA